MPKSISLMRVKILLEKGMKLKHQNSGEKEEKAEFVPYTFMSVVQINIKIIMPLP